MPSQRFKPTIQLETTLQVNDSGQQSYLNQHFSQRFRSTILFERRAKSTIPRFRSTILFETALQVNDSGQQFCLSQHFRSTIQVKNPIWKGARSTIQVIDPIKNNIAGQRFKSTILSKPAFQVNKSRSTILSKTRLQVNDPIGNTILGHRFRSTILLETKFQVNNSSQRFHLKQCWTGEPRFRLTTPFEMAFLVNDSG